MEGGRGGRREGVRSQRAMRPNTSTMPVGRRVPVFMPALAAMVWAKMTEMVLLLIVTDELASQLRKTAAALRQLKSF